MKTKYYYHIVTFGCQMNVHESEKLASICEKMGYALTENREDADLIIFNTCAIREGAEDRVFGNIGALKRMKKQNKDLIIAVCGCMTQKQQTADYMIKTFPFVDIVIGTFNLANFESYVEAVKHARLVKQKSRQLDLWNEGEIDESVPYLRTSGENAWVNIMQGCNNFCTYCIVPYVRGREKSRKKENILSEIREIVASGKYKKITLLGQNVNSYGKDLSPQVSFAQLLKEICAIEGDFKVWFMTSHPKDLTDEVIEVIAKEDKILKDIHLPAQSGNNRILTLMNRRYTREKYLGIIEKIRQLMPNCRITSDFIVGFPTETEEEFQDTFNLVKQVKFDSIFAFMYSPREGTVAAKMEGQIADEVKNRRVNELLNLEKKIQKEEGKK
ncbi:MAG: tRNA (N6-isopentenyl adenosine(37)-C2)-methylthiotransferase MiaB [Clostridia bacterium]|nr:tRNA (N6-isopentenyl adenosine(37)-C2)-methylthiotransferase MiaB [Clostridia bacterium]